MSELETQLITRRGVDYLPLLGIAKVLGCCVQRTVLRRYGGFIHQREIYMPVSNVPLWLNRLKVDPLHHDLWFDVRRAVSDLVAHRMGMTRHDEVYRVAAVAAESAQMIIAALIARKAAPGHPQRYLITLDSGGRNPTVTPLPDDALLLSTAELIEAIQGGDMLAMQAADLAALAHACTARLSQQHARQRRDKQPACAVARAD